MGLNLPKGQSLSELLQDPEKLIAFTKEQLENARKTLTEQLKTFDTSYQRILNPHIYKVSLSEKLKNLKLDFIEERIK